MDEVGAIVEVLAFSAVLNAVGGFVVMGVEGD